MSYSHSRSSYSSSKSGGWKRRSSGSSETRSQNTPIKKGAKDATPDLKQRAITSYFGAKSPKSPTISKSSSALPTLAHNGTFNASQTSTPSSLPASSQASLESTQVITILDDEPNDETDSQTTVVLEELEPLMTQMIDESQYGSASPSTLYYTDELDEILQYYDLESAVALQDFKEAQKEQWESRNKESPVPSNEPSYYLSNFMAILKVVEEKDSHLFSDEEKAAILKLRAASVDEQRLFSRLLYRKGPWFQTIKLEYSDIFDIKGTIERLIAAGILEEPSGVLDVLPSLSNSQLRQLTRASSNLKRDQLITVASKWVSSQRTLDGRPIKIPKDIGQCVRIREFIDVLFKRVHRLFFLNQVEDQSTLMMIHTGQLKFPTYVIPPHKIKKDHPKDLWVHDSVCSYELSTSFVNDDMGPTPPGSPNASQRELREFLFPNAPISESSAVRVLDELENVHILRKVGFSSVFKTRADLDEYEEALEMSHNLMELMGADIDVDNDTTDNDKRKKQMLNVRNLNDPRTLNAAMRIVEDAIFKYQLKRSSSDNNMANQSVEDSNLPLGSHLFLKRFTAMWVYTSIIWVGVSLLERQKKYKEAISYLKLLLDQFDVNRGRRGDWWIRLIFDVAHMKDTDHAIELCCGAIRDENCRPQHLLKLYDKLRILIKNKLREAAKEEKENEKKRKAEEKSRKKRRKGEEEEEDIDIKSPPRIKKAASAIVDIDEDEKEVEVKEEFKTPMKAGRPKRGAQSKKAASTSPTGPTDAPSPDTASPSTNSSNSPVSPISAATQGQSSPKGRRGIMAVPIPLPGEELPEFVLKTDPEANGTYSLDRVVPGQRSQTSSPDRPIGSPSLRYTSPVRYQSPEKPTSSSPLSGSTASPSALKSEHQFDPSNLDFDWFEDAWEPIAEIPADILEEMKKLNVPLPEKLDEGTIETIYGRKQALGLPSPSGWGNRSVFVRADGSPCSVEEYSLQHYKSLGWPKGVHCEGMSFFFHTT